MTLLAWVVAAGVVVTDRMGVLSGTGGSEEATSALAFRETSSLGANLALLLLLPAAVALCAAIALRIRHEDQAV